MLKEHKTNTNLGIGLGFLLMLLARTALEGTFAPSTVQIVLVAGAVLFLWGCISYARGKGHSALWGLVALIPLLGLIILVALPDHHAQGTGRLRRGCAYGIIAVLLFFLGVGGWIAYHERQPATVEEAQRKALKLYPQLGVLNSPLNREFVARYKNYQATNKDFFRQPHWPLILAAESEEALKRSPSR